MQTRPDQDRHAWNRVQIEEGQELVRACLRKGHPGPYQLQAAINAVHSDASSAAATDWRQIVELYDQLFTFLPTPVVYLNRCVALAQIEGPEIVLALVDELDLKGYYLFHATRADLLRRLGRSEPARAEYLEALRHSENAAERAFLSRRVEAL